MADYNLEGVKWGSATLGTPGGAVTWAFDSSVPASFQNDFATAFNSWAGFGNIQFTELGTNSNANIIVNYGNIDGAGGVAGLTNYVYSGGMLQSATITIDSSEGWHASGNNVVSNTNFPLELVAAHETGHAIGLAHYNASPAVMNATISSGISGLQQSDIDGVQAIYGTVCYATGTRIRTIHGDLPVEDLRVGDLAVTASGEQHPIRWIGHRMLDLRDHPGPDAVLPVRIAAGALGPNRPERDLVLSPGHAICLDVLGEVLIPAVALVNGATITQEPVESVTYWHVELDSHDILLAEGQAAESYLDTGNRAFFAESGPLDRDAGPDADPARKPGPPFCRPYQAEGALVDFVWQRLRERALGLGWTLQQQPLGGLHLEVDGQVVQADVAGRVAHFVLPAAAQDVWLVSSTVMPAMVKPPCDDRRALGLSIDRLTIDDGLSVRRAIAMDDARLGEGFHPVEADPAHGTVWRWTRGRARLPADLWAGCQGRFFLRVELAEDALPRLVGPGRAIEEAGQPGDRHLRLVDAAA